RTCANGVRSSWWRFRGWRSSDADGRLWGCRKSPAPEFWNSHVEDKGGVMKVVLFCGGLGMRMRADNQSLPKPMMPIGSRPVLWHVMRYYAHFGHNEFILCLGYGAEAVKNYFLDYRETASNDFVITKGGKHVEMLSTDISDWTISFIDTGMDTAIGERLRRVRPYLEGDEVFLANYGDVLTDASQHDLVDAFV